MSTFLELSSIKSPDFFHTFAVNFALAPVVLHPLQYGASNLEVVYCGLGKCLVLENIHAHPTQGQLELQEGGGRLESQNLKVPL